MTSFLVLFRFVGYGLLLLTLFDVVSAVIPPQFNSPAWQFQTAGGFVERSAVPLIGFILVFYDNHEARKKRELIVLRILSWIALLSGVFYFALVVVFFITPPTLNDMSQKQVTARAENRPSQTDSNSIRQSRNLTNRSFDEEQSSHGYRSANI
jgi:drug/metabolite transporter (DMT)-like permease